MAPGQRRVLSLHPTLPTSSAKLLPKPQGSREETMPLQGWLAAPVKQLSLADVNCSCCLLRDLAAGVDNAGEGTERGR